MMKVFECLRRKNNATPHTNVTMLHAQLRNGTLSRADYANKLSELLNARFIDRETAKQLEKYNIDIANMGTMPPEKCTKAELINITMALNKAAQALANLSATVTNLSSCDDFDDYDTRYSNVQLPSESDWDAMKNNATVIHVADCFSEKELYTFARSHASSVVMRISNIVFCYTNLVKGGAQF